jgi:hypothetical protein
MMGDQDELHDKRRLNQTLRLTLSAVEVVRQTDRLIY